MTLSQCVLCCLSLIQWVPCELRSSQWAEPRLVGPVSPEPKSSSLSPHAKKTKPPEGCCLLNYCQIPAKSLKGSCCCCQFSDKPPMVFHHLHRWTPEILFQCSCWLLEGPLRCCYNHHRGPTCFVITGLLLDQMSSTSAAGIPPCLVTLSSRGLPSSSLPASSIASSITNQGAWKPPSSLLLASCLACRRALFPQLPLGASKASWEVPSCLLLLGDKKKLVYNQSLNTSCLKGSFSLPTVDWCFAIGLSF